MDYSLIKIQRTRHTADGIFGVLTCGDFSCVTVENLEHAIPEGLYSAKLDLSPRLVIVTPHIAVPLRDEQAGGDAGIRIHPANLPSQLLGCIAVGDKIDGDAVDDSRQTFASLMKILPNSFQVLVYAQH